jgi:phosphoribosylformylglycinamidine cyclo-ligase
MTTSMKYEDSGVNIEAGNNFVDMIKPLAKSTKIGGTDASLGGFGGIFDLELIKDIEQPVLVSATDGVGTKLKLATILNKHDTIGIDLVAMCVNDLVVQGAKPLFFLDYYATGKLLLNVGYDIVSGIANGCIQAGCALIGGETAEMPGHYHGEEYDLAGFSVGVVGKKDLLPKKNIVEGDVIIGLASSGVHSNGYSLVRHILAQKNINLSDPSPISAGHSIGEDLIAPTKIYVKSCLEAIKTGKVKALAHITGGGLLENIPRVMEDNLCANIDLNSWEMLPIFKWLQKEGNVAAEEMLKTFNCGIGMILVLHKEDVIEVTEIFTNMEEQCYVIGKIEKSDSQKPYVKFTNIDKL